MPYKASLVETINTAVKEWKPTKDKPNRKPNKDDKSKPDEVCEECKVSCKKLISTDKTKGIQTYRITRKRITHYYVNFTKKAWYFGMDCPCAENFKKANQQTCPQCQKTEWPDMKKGWMLDYEVKKAFCSPMCHVKYRQLKWEVENLTVEMMPPELELSTNEGQNTDWEKEGLKREVLFWREYARELEARLSNQSNLTPEERQQSNYLRRLQQNTLQRAESSYRSRYGELTEDNPNKGKGLSVGIIALLIIGGIAVVGTIIFLLTRKRNKK
jgi:hypothetical protein